MAALFCSRCGKPIPPTAPQCPACGAPRPGNPALAAPPVGLPRNCVNCRVQMRLMGQVNLRSSSWFSGVDPLLGATSQVSETLHPFSLYYCAQCGKFDLYYPGT